jgi:hypothetical protein
MTGDVALAKMIRKKQLAFVIINLVNLNNNDQKIFIVFYIQRIVVASNSTNF